MTTDELADRLGQRFKAAGLLVGVRASQQLASYIGLLTKWNGTINLTSLELDPPSDTALDRLIIEPVSAASAMGDGLLIDLGSGGGSPAIPLAIVRPALTLIMVESRGRKAAFLREAIRRLKLDRASVGAHRYQDLITDPSLAHRAQFVSLRAVRADQDLWQVIRHLLAPRGRVLWFGGLRHANEGVPSDFIELAPPPERASSDTLILQRRDPEGAADQTPG
jgi:16S rRNA (guanine527-N7)-methyltransferase